MTQRTGRPSGLTPRGQEIRRLRVALGLTAAQLAPRVGLHPKSLMQTESKNRRISDVTASRLARALGVRMSDISDWDGDDDTGSGAETKIPA
jgi:transcriptional regulator with XRE-family HTH domain